MIYSKSIVLGILLISASAVIEKMNSAPRSHDRSTSSKTSPNSNVNRGQQVFNQNCSRCHNAPQGFPSRISGTIAKHMRVRAELSGADYDALLQFLGK